MPHYKNEREAKVGDLVLSRGYDGKQTPSYGIVVSISSGSSTCNAMIAPYDPTRQLSVTLSECVHVDDVFPANGATPDSPKPA